MPNESVLGAADLAIDAGVPEHNRRLSDKVLEAFTHAYSIGEVDVAKRLRAILVELEEQGQQRFPGRRESEAAAQADSWVQFVEARDDYRRLSQSSKADPDRVTAALEQMKEAYKNWSMR